MDENIKQIFDHYINEEWFSGVVCKAVYNKDIIFYEASGKRCILDNEDTMKKDTIFDIASLTKIFTTTMTLRLITLNKLALDTRVGDVLNETEKFPHLKEHISNVTIKQLLTHSAGIIPWYPFYCEEGTFYEVLDKVIKNSEPVKGVEYSDINFMILGQIIKNITELSLDKALNKYVVRPLGMKNTSYGPIDDENVASTEFGNRIEKQMCSDINLDFKGWRRDDQPIKGKVNDGNAHYYFHGVSGHAGIFSNACDLMKLLNVYIEGGELEGKSFISKSLIEESTKIQISSKGLGWDFSDIYPTGCGHTGFTGTSLWIDTELKVGVVLLTNRLNVRNNTRNINEFRKKIHEKILKEIKEGNIK